MHLSTSLLLVSPHPSNPQNPRPMTNSAPCLRRMYSASERLFLSNAVKPRCCTLIREIHIWANTGTDPRTNKPGMQSHSIPWSRSSIVVMTTSQLVQVLSESIRCRKTGRRLYSHLSVLDDVRPSVLWHRLQNLCFIFPLIVAFVPATGKSMCFSS